MQTISCLSSLTWFVIGAFWRYSRGGQVASGDKLEREAGSSDEEWEQDVANALLADGYQIHRGKAMTVLLYGLMIAFLALVFIGTLSFMIFECFCGNEEKRADNNTAS